MDDTGNMDGYGGRKLIRSTSAQMTALLDYMSQHKDLANGNFPPGPLGQRMKHQAWEKLRKALTCLGPDKSVEKWQHTWRDMKKRARKQWADLNEARGSLDDSDTELLVEIPHTLKKIMEIVSDQTLTPPSDTAAPEPKVTVDANEENFNQDDPLYEPSTSSSRASPTPSVSISSPHSFHEYIVVPTAGNSNLKTASLIPNSPSRSVVDINESKRKATSPHKYGEKKGKVSAISRQLVIEQRRTTKALNTLCELMLDQNKMMREHNEFIRKRASMQSLCKIMVEQNKILKQRNELLRRNSGRNTEDGEDFFFE